MSDELKWEAVQGDRVGRQPPQPGDQIGAASWADERDGQFVETATIRAVADQDWTADYQPVRWEFYIKPAGKDALERVATASPVGWAYTEVDGRYVLSTEEPTHSVVGKTQVYVLKTPFEVDGSQVFTATP